MIQSILLLAAATVFVIILLPKSVKKAKTWQQNTSRFSRFVGFGSEAGIYAFLTFYILWFIGILLSLRQ